MKKPEDLMKDMSRLLQEIKRLNNKKEILSEQITSVATQNVLTQARSIANTWGRAYAEFKEFRPLLRNVFITYGMRAIPKREKQSAHVDITQEPEDVLVEKLRWAASRFITEFQQHIVKQSVALKNSAQEVVNSAMQTEDLQNEDLIRKVSVLNSLYLPFELAIGDNLYANLTNVIRYAEAIVDKYVSPDQKLGRPPKGGYTKTKYNPTPMDSTEEIADSTSQAIEHIKAFFNATSGIAEEIESLVKAAMSLHASQPQTADTVEGEEEPSLEPAPVPDPTVRRKKRGWLNLAWAGDPYINTTLK